MLYIINEAGKWRALSVLLRKLAFVLTGHFCRRKAWPSCDPATGKHLIVKSEKYRKGEKKQQQREHWRQNYRIYKRADFVWRTAISNVLNISPERKETILICKLIYKCHGWCRESYDQHKMTWGTHICFTNASSRSRSFTWRNTLTSVL